MGGCEVDGGGTEQWLTRDQVDAEHPQKDHSSPRIPESGHLIISSSQSLGTVEPAKALGLGLLLI